MCKANFLDWVATILVIIGALNWGLIGFFGFNLVAALFGTAVVAHIVYILVGLSGLYMIYLFTKMCKRCKKSE